MKGLISQLMQNSGVSNVSCVTGRDNLNETGGFNNNSIATPKNISDVSSATNPVLKHLLHNNKSKVYQEEPKETKVKTPATPKTPHSQIKPDLSYIFDWHLQKLQNTHGDNLPITTLEVIAFDRTQEDWLRHNMPPVIKYDAVLILERKEKSRNALILSGVKPCKRLEDLDKRSKK